MGHLLAKLAVVIRTLSVKLIPPPERGVCVCVKALTIAKGFWKIDKHLLYSCRGVQHDCGTALNEATAVMGYRV